MSTEIIKRNFSGLQCCPISMERESTSVWQDNITPTKNLKSHERIPFRTRFSLLWDFYRFFVSMAKWEVYSFNTSPKERPSHSLPAVKSLKFGWIFRREHIHLGRGVTPAFLPGSKHLANLIFYNFDIINNSINNSEWNPLHIWHLGVRFSWLETTISDEIGSFHREAKWKHVCVCVRVFIFAL